MCCTHQSFSGAQITPVTGLQYQLIMCMSSRAGPISQLPGRIANINLLTEFVPISQGAHSLFNSLCSREKIDLKQKKGTTLLTVKDTGVALSCHAREEGSVDRCLLVC